MPLKVILTGVIFGILAQTYTATPEQAGRSHMSLIISVEQYDNVPDVVNAERDAKAIARRLSELGYGVFHLRNPNRDELLRTLAAMRLASAEASQVVVYLAGHGFQNGATSYFLTRDVRLNTSSDEFSHGAIPLRMIIRAISDKPRQKIVLFDACRTPPELNIPSHPAPSTTIAPAGLLLAYAAGAGQPAFDGVGSFSPFATAFLRQMQTPDRPLIEILRNVRLDVVQQTGGRQVPWVQSSLLRPAILVPQIRP
ncbi:caspase family protein [Roseovarius sp. EL26]|uniref:caspase family protein n=1 Tax=Roseovarius sp. EL26 TaxID=2126672 RepID=UPI000EA35DD1|nr:caspase family protein [Roseovarius sp. EL26]